MVAEDGEMTNGWPFGLENMSMRLRMAESLQAAAARPFSFRVRSTSFSSFTSSDLDTESTRSFFQDRSVSLGRLIRIRPEDKGNLYFTDSIGLEEHRQVNVGCTSSDAIKRHEMTVSRGICIPLLQCVLVKITPSRNSSRR